MDECRVFSGDKPVKNMTALVSWLVDDVDKALLREQGAEFLDIGVGLYIKVAVEVPDDNVLSLSVSRSSGNDSKSCRNIFVISLSRLLGSGR